MGQSRAIRLYPINQGLSSFIGQKRVLPHKLQAACTKSRANLSLMLPLPQSRFRFFAQSILAELKQSRGYQIAAALYPLIGAIALAAWFISMRSPAQYLTSWSREEKLILVLIFVCIGLIILLIGVVDGARRFHVRTIKDLITEHTATVEGQNKRIRELDETLEEETKKYNFEKNQKENLWARVNSVESELRTLKIQYKWLYEIAEADAGQIHYLIPVEHCTNNLDYLSDDEPYIEFTFTIFNGSVYTVSIEDEVKGKIAFCTPVPNRATVSNFNLLSKEIEIVKDLKELAHGKRDRFRIRQHLKKREAEDIKKAWDAGQGHFDFDRLIISVSARDVDSERLILMRGLTITNIIIL